MNYKVLTFVFAALFVAVSIYAWYLKQNPDCYNEISKAAHEKLTQAGLDEDTGGPIDWKIAQAALVNYKKEFGVDCDKKKKVDLYGFAFGFNEFKKYAQRLVDLDTTYNFLGVRVYMSLKEGEFDGQKEKYHDVFLVPIMPGGGNFYPELDDCTGKETSIVREEGDLVLNTSMLCPNRCEAKK